MIYLLNSPVLTAHGIYDLTGPCSAVLARELVARGFESAIGHVGAAELLSQILGTAVPVRRQAVRMQQGDRALTLRLLQRLPEGKVMDGEELARWPHELALLERIA